MKIAIYAIAKDEQKHVDRFMDSCVGADLVVVGVDPGDTTGKLLASRGATVHRVSIPKFRFDHYRNKVLAKIPGDVDVCISMDLDEVLPPNWRETIERDWRPGTTRLHYWLRWDPSKEETFRYDRIHARHGYEWRYPNHEAVIAINPMDERLCFSDLTITQHADLTKDRSKNLKLLEDAVAEDPYSVRMMWYLAREYHMQGEDQDAIVTFRKYLNLKPTWEAERSWACIFVSRCYRNLNLHLDSIAWLHYAIRTAPDLRDPYLELARIYADSELWSMAETELDNASRILSNTHNFFHSNGAYGRDFYLLSGRVLKVLGKKNAAMIAYCHALRIDPTCKEASEGMDSVQ
jgi:tetratricopeptide (TPR) repeat protein